MLAGLQGSGKTTLAGKLGRWLKGQGHTPLLVACDLQRPNAVNQLQVVGERAGVEVFAPRARQRRRRPGAAVRRADSIEHARRAQHDIVIVDTAGRLGIDAEMMQQAADIRDAVEPGRDPLRRRRDGRPGRGHHRRGVPRRRRLHRRRADQARRRRPRWRRAVGPRGHRPADHVRLHRREARGLRRLPPRPDGLPHPRHGRRAHPDRAGRAAPSTRTRPRRWPRSSRPATTSPSTTSSSRCRPSAGWARSPTCSACCPAWAR